MTSFTKDPLLGAARILLIFFIALLGATAALLVAAVPVLLIMRDSAIAQMAGEGIADGGALILPIVLVMLGVAGLLALAVWFLVLLRQIVNSVGEGDPFVPANAVRLARMGWIALAGQLASIPLAGMGLWLVELIAGRTKADLHADMDGGLDFSGVLLVLVLFILARVFRQGARMREELEGTV
jgi:hypothetical protein